MVARKETPLHLGRRLKARPTSLSILGWSLFVGVLAGLVGAAFRFGVSHAKDGMTLLRGVGGGEGASALTISVVSSAVALGIALILVRRFAPEAAGSGIQEIEGALDGVRPLRWARVLCVKFTAGLLSLGAGMVMGREGPTVQMGGALGKMLHERFGLSEDEGRLLIAAGAGAGLTAAFNAPLTGMLFVVEEMRPQFKYNVISVQCVLIACVSADMVVRTLIGSMPAFAFGIFEMPSLTALLSIALFGVLLGGVGWLFNTAVLRLMPVTTRLSLMAQLGVVVLIGALMGGLVQLAPDLAGGGYSAIQTVMSGRVPELSLLLVFICRFGLTVLCFVSGVPGGIFAPIVALGTIFGLWFSGLIPSLLPAASVDPGVFMIVGAGALFAATVRAPITGIVLAAELTGNFGLILPIAIGCITATLTAHALGGRPIYAALLAFELDREAADGSESVRSPANAGS